jgi:CubicO group peptidase (beta-lactamase class C family)
MLGELLRNISGQSYPDYVRDQLLAPLNLADDIYPDPGHRNAHQVPTRAGLRSYLLNRKHPYITLGCEIDAHCNYLACPMGDPNCTPVACGSSGTCLGCDANQQCEAGWTCVAGECLNLAVPHSASEPPPPLANPLAGDGSPDWAPNAGPPDPSAPATAAQTSYAGRVYTGGAPLAAGGWYGDGVSLGVLTRTLVQTSFLMPQAVAAQLWNPVWWNLNHSRGPGWSYGLGWWIRGNWVAMAGGAPGSMATAAHNRAYDLTVVHLTNVEGNGLGEFFVPLMASNNAVWGTSILGMLWPCVDDLSTPASECTGVSATY